MKKIYFLSWKLSFSHSVMTVGEKTESAHWWSEGVYHHVYSAEASRWTWTRCETLWNKQKPIPSTHPAWTEPEFPATCTPPRQPSRCPQSVSYKVDTSCRTSVPELHQFWCWRSEQDTWSPPWTASWALPLRCRTRDFPKPEKQKGKERELDCCSRQTSDYTQMQTHVNVSDSLLSEITPISSRFRR